MKRSDHSSDDVHCHTVIVGVHRILVNLPKYDEIHIHTKTEDTTNIHIYTYAYIHIQYIHTCL
jgi:hypothetical protein